ncbi:hypothetical protein [Hydrogenovibrio kuenenii]|uniref:hypothetical protein n=1 Tax=Hydrogenovibrio kuenenii TaxID=63658 RepID=UPI0004662E57|nr:hypothetical protein [Hydrogenovibrio kuenenii]
MTASLDWIRLECIPLPDSRFDPCVVFWNPNEQKILGDAAEQILQWVADAEQKGYISTPTLTHFEIVSPLTQPSELAAILAQYYWVIPEPVSSPEENAMKEVDSIHLLH